MSEPVELILKELSELEIMEFEEALEAEGLGDTLEIVRRDATLPSGALGEPALASLLISIAPQLLPTLAAAVVLWIGKRRSGSTTRAKKISLSRHGLEIVNFEQSTFDSAASESAVQALVSEALTNVAK